MQWGDLRQGGELPRTTRRWLALLGLTAFALAVGGCVGTPRALAPTSHTGKSTPAATHHVDHGGARRLPPPMAATVAPCVRAQLTGMFWRTFEGMGHVIAGVDLRNSSTSACLLPAYPSHLGILSSAGQPLSERQLPGARGRPGPDFLSYLVAPGVGIGVDYRAKPGPLELLPGGTAVLVLFELLPMPGSLPAGTPCVAAPRGARLAVELRPATKPLQVVIPDPGPVSKRDPSGSELASCSAITYTPLLTWPKASRLVPVGAPTGSRRYDVP